MSKYQEYLEIGKQIAELMEKKSRLKDDEEVVKATQFKEELDGLMEKYGMTAGDVVELVAGKASKKRPTRKERSPKTWTNPHTGEVVHSKGANHKTLNAWRDQYGKEAVQEWVG